MKSFAVSSMGSNASARVRVARVLVSRPVWTQTSLAAAAGVSRSTAYRVLSDLADSGEIAVRYAQTGARPELVYRVTRETLAALRSRIGEFVAAVEQMGLDGFGFADSLFGRTGVITRTDHSAQAWKRVLTAVSPLVV